MEMDQTLYWNEVALEANRLSFTNLQPGEVPEQGGPTLSSRALGIIHLAMHDAYVGTSGTTKFGPYMASLPSADAGASYKASIAGAAYTALVALYPKQKSFFDKKLGPIASMSSSEDAGYSYGRDIANTLYKKGKMTPTIQIKVLYPRLVAGIISQIQIMSRNFLPLFTGQNLHHSP